MEESDGLIGKSIRQVRQRGEIVGLFFVLAVMPMTSAESQELHGLASSSLSTIESKVEGITTDTENFAHALDLNWNRSVSPYLSYRITLRGQDSRNRTKLDSISTRTSAMLVEPIFDVTLATPAYSLNTGLRLRERINDGKRVKKVRISDRRMFARFFLTPERLPSFSFQVDRATSEDDRSPKIRDTEDRRYEVSTQYGFGGADFSYTFSDRVREDNANRLTRYQETHLGTMGYTGTFFDDRLDVRGDYNVNYSPNREKISSAAVVEIERQLRRGLKAAPDLSPADSSDVPLTNAPGLAAGTADIPLELNISIGFELLRRESVTEIRISLAPQPPFSLPDLLQQFLNFRVFLTDDTTLTTWSEVVGVSQRFDPIEEQFILTFSAATARSFKAYVNRNDFGFLIKATKITALDSDAVAAGTERRASSLLHNVGAGFTVRPIKEATATYNFSLTDLTQNPRSVQTTSGLHTATLVVEPHRLLTASFLYQYSYNDSNQDAIEDTTATTYNLTFNSNPLPTLTSALSLVRLENRSEGDLDRRSDTASMTTSAEVYRDLNVDSTFSLSRVEDFTTDLESFTQTSRIGAIANLTSRLSAILGYTLERARTEQPGLDTNITTQTAEGVFTYTVSNFFNFTARLDFFYTKDQTTFSQEYKLDVNPTSKISSFIDYRRVKQTNGDTTGSDTITFNGRWNISRYLSLDANGSYLRSFNGDTVQSFSSLLRFRF